MSAAPYDQAQDEKRRLLEQHLIHAMREAELADAQDDPEYAQLWIDQFNALDRMLASEVAR